MIRVDLTPFGSGSAEHAPAPALNAAADSFATRAVRSVCGFPATALLAIIAVYQRTLSPLLPVITLGRCGCRFHPSCSRYAADAIGTHGALRGLSLAVWRVLKCSPLHPGGFDPVPPRHHVPTCRRAG
jgi:putative membrane protein insertion efficiency factor